MATRIQIKETNGEKRITATNKPLILIGRSARCDVRLVSDVVSSTHARLKVYRDAIAIEDMGSSNGTFINGARVDGAINLGPADVVQLGVGGPTIQLVDESGNVAAVATPEARHEQPAASAPSFPMAKLIIGGLAIALLAMILLCGLGGGAGLFFWGSTREGGSIAKIVKNKEELSNAVGLVVVGFDGISLDGKKVVGKLGTGTGFCVTPDGYVYTNQHVVDAIVTYQKHEHLVIEDSKTGKEVVLPKAALQNYFEMNILSGKVWVVLNGTVHDANIVHVSDKFDFCILKIQAQGLPYFRLSSVDDLEGATDVYALGFPGESMVGISIGTRIMDARKAKNQPSVADLFKASDFVLSMTNGIISRAVPDEASKIWWLSHTANIHQGNSGGPLCLPNGIVAAINTQMINDPDAANPLPTYYSFTMAQLRDEALRWSPGVKWAVP